MSDTPQDNEMPMPMLLDTSDIDSISINIDPETCMVMVSFGSVMIPLAPVSARVIGNMTYNAGVQATEAMLNRMVSSLNDPDEGDVTDSHNPES